MPALSPAALRRRARDVRLFIFDIDGVLTDGLLYHIVDSAGTLIEFKGVNTQDSIALSWLPRLGLVTGCISGRDSEGMSRRLRMLHVAYVYQGRLDKRAVFDEICRKARLAPRQALYIGDDLPDIPVLSACGLAAAPANARSEVKAAAHWVTRSAGGSGAVREAAELVLRAQGLWPKVLALYDRTTDKP
ncbi:MAG: HAD hydrolase family protein [Elusimicrobia bacterium]|nr:HAD hydrolase family protein [Elusimicrobiota bacterium]MDE2237479.1 HAD hydrolase family protein [Elusimicrobiota bacterium]MDE2425882.1 HAD hydrolase family protein [Elusimicrobiota bacterium]